MDTSGFRGRSSSLVPLHPNALSQHFPPTPPNQPADVAYQPKMPLMNSLNPPTSSHEESPDMAYVGSHTHSLTWISPMAQQEDMYELAKNSIERHFRKYDRDMLVPLKNLKEWCKHGWSMKVVRTKLEERRITEKELLRHIRADVPGGLHKPFDGRKLSVGQGSVLCSYSIWCPEFETDWRRIAPWPCITELKWEGEDRARTNVGRFFPLPREPSNGTVPWNHLPQIHSSPFDEIWKVPTQEDVLYPMEQISAEVEADKHRLLNEDLLDALSPGSHDIWAKGDLPGDNAALGLLTDQLWRKVLRDPRFQKIGEKDYIVRKTIPTQ